MVLGSIPVADLCQCVATVEVADDFRGSRLPLLSLLVGLEHVPAFLHCFEAQAIMLVCQVGPVQFRASAKSKQDIASLITKRDSMLLH